MTLDCLAAEVSSKLLPAPEVSISLDISPLRECDAFIRVSCSEGA